jgi:hypothetical protein
MRVPADTRSDSCPAYYRGPGRWSTPGTSGIPRHRIATRSLAGSGWSCRRISRLTKLRAAERGAAGLIADQTTRCTRRGRSILCRAMKNGDLYCRLIQPSNGFRYHSFFWFLLVISCAFRISIVYCCYYLIVISITLYYSFITYSVTYRQVILSRNDKTAA